MTKLTDRQLADLAAEHVMEWKKVGNWWMDGEVRKAPVMTFDPHTDWNDAMRLKDALNLDEIKKLTILMREYLEFFDMTDLTPRMFTEIVLEAKGIAT